MQKDTRWLSRETRSCVAIRIESCCGATLKGNELQKEFDQLCLNTGWILTNSTCRFCVLNECLVYIGVFNIMEQMI